MLAACGSSGSSGSSSGSTGREIKIGFVSPLTGPLATFGGLDQYCVTRWQEATKGGLKCGDGKTHPISIIVKDSQSDLRAATVAGDLITNSGVDIMMVAFDARHREPRCLAGRGAPGAVHLQRLPVAAVLLRARRHAHNAIQVDVPRVLGPRRRDGGLHRHVEHDQDQQARRRDVAERRRRPGLGQPQDGQPPLLKAAGYNFVDGGRFQDGTQDYTPQITKFKSSGVDIVSGVFIPPDFVNFWKQAAQQGLHPRVVSIGKALLFPAEMEAIGSIGYGLTTECWWSPWHPFKSSLTGETCSQLAADWTKRTGKEWAQPLLHYAVFEIVADVLKRTTNVDDKQAILNAILATDLNTVQGHITWKGGPLNPVKNVCRTVLVGGSWVKGTTYPFELELVDTAHAAAAPFFVKIPQNGKIAPLTAV